MANPKSDAVNVNGSVVGSIRESFIGITYFVRRIRVLLIAAALAFLLFAFPAQTLELYSELTQELHARNLVPLAIAFSSLVLLGAVLWLCADSLLTKEPSPCLSEKARRIYDWCRRWIPCPLALLPVLAVTVGLLQVLTVTDDSDERPHQALYVAFAAAAAAVLTTIGVVTLVRRTLWPGEAPAAAAKKIRSIFVLGVLFFAGGLLLAFHVTSAQMAGPMLSFALFIALFSAMLSVATYYGDVRNIPVLAILIVLMLVFSVFNDNHEVKHTILSEAAQAQRAEGVQSEAGAFEKWLASRGDRGEFGERYPVFIVAAQGGGLYAAYHTAMFLARIQDACPGFAQHTFAISGVSGGAIGATIFTALASAMAANGPFQACLDRDAIVSQGPFETRIDSALSRDFLSPVISRALFADLGQRLLPWPVGLLDRARALEEAFAEALQYDDCTGSRSAQRLLDQSIFGYWTPSGAAPALLLNTTVVERGDQLIISPFPFEGNEASGRPVLNLFSQRADIDMSLATAAVLSARFPIVTPAGSLRGGEGGLPYKFRLVDGGYYDNSGIETALGLIAELARGRPDLTQQVDVVLLIFTHDHRVIFGRKDDYLLGEIMSPVRAMLNARVSRGYNSSARRAFWEQNYFWKQYELPVTVYALPLSEPINDTTSFKPPLGWFLSEETRNAIRKRIGDPLHLRNDSCLPEDRTLERLPFSLETLTQAQVAADAAVTDIRGKLSP